MPHDLDPPPNMSEITDKEPTTIWQTWFNNLYEKIKELVVAEVQKSAFGEQLVAEIEPQVQADFSYGVNSDIWHKHQNNGTEEVENHQLKIATTATSGRSSAVFSKSSVKYNPGQGGLFRCSAIFTTGVTGTTQLAGLGDAGDGYFFGYNGADFGLLRRRGGHVEVRTLTVTTASSTAENITITLDGDSDATVAVTASAVISTTANEIAAHDYSNLGTGWEAHSDGDGTVTFVSYDAAAHAGSYTYTATTAVVSYAQNIAGVAPADTWTKQTDWNVDKMSGTGSSMTLDPTKGNVYQIRYQWLGYGMIRFYVETDTTGKLTLVHEIRYANANVLPSVNNPTLPICYMVTNGAVSSDIVLYSGSCMGGSEGKHEGVDHLHHSATVSTTGGIGTTETPILTVHNPIIWQGVPNRKRPRISSATCSIDGTKPAIVRLRLNGTLVAASYNDVETNVSTLEFDIASTAISNGDVKYSDGMSKVDRVNLPINENYRIYPGDRLSLTVQGVGGTAGATGITGAINVEEEY